MKLIHLDVYNFKYSSLWYQFTSLSLIRGKVRNSGFSGANSSSWSVNLSWGFPVSFNKRNVSDSSTKSSASPTERWHQPNLQELLLGNLNITIGNHHFPWENSLNMAIFPMEMMKMPQSRQLEPPGGIDPSYSPRTPAEVIDLFTQAWIEKDLNLLGMHVLKFRCISGFRYIHKP